MRIWRAIAVLALVVGMAAGPATAEPAEPHFTDGCGVAGLSADPTDGATTPWTDICRGWFETLGGSAGGLRLTVVFDGAIDDDRLALYVAQWRAGDCEYRVSHDRGLGQVGAGGVFVNDVGGDWLRVRCGAPVEAPCPATSVGTSPCLVYPDERFYGLGDAVTIDGASLSWTLRFTDTLAPLAADFTDGVQLTNAWVRASTKVFLAAMAPGWCSGDQCGQIGGDFAAGRVYTVGE